MISSQEGDFILYFHPTEAALTVLVHTVPWNLFYQCINRSWYFSTNHLHTKHFMLIPSILIMLMLNCWCILIDLCDIPEINQDVLKKLFDMLYLLLIPCYVIHLKMLFSVAFTQRIRLPSLSRMVTGCALFFCVSKVWSRRSEGLCCSALALLSYMHVPPLPLNSNLPFYVYRWLASLHPELGVPFRLKRPKFLKDV
jgi:hypothetical protein